MLVAAAHRAGEDRGQVLVLCPSVGEARVLGRRLRRDGVPTAIVAADGPGAVATGEWTSAAGGQANVVVGARAAAWAPAPNLSRVIVLDEGLIVEEGAPASVFTAPAHPRTRALLARITP